MNYNDLQTAIADWLNRTDLGATIPRFIRNAEARINRRLRHRLMEVETSLTFDADGYAPLPTDFVELRSLRTPMGGREVFLEEVSPASAEWFRVQRPSTPQYCAILADQIVTRPAVQGLSKIHYYARIPSLSSQAPVNWVLERFPDLYIYGSLIEGASYLRDPQLLEMAATLFNDALSGASFDHKHGKMERPQTMPPTPATETLERRAG